MKNIDFQKTIFALASAQGRAGVSVMRVSGPAASEVLKILTGRKLPKPRSAVLRALTNVAGEKIDEALVLWFVGPGSFTGEDMVELQTHGSVAVIESLSRALFSMGLSQAGPGEFSRRAFQNGKMDLTEAEGLADLIDAQTDTQRSQALRQMQGGLKDIYESWREQVLDSLAFVEGEIDFPDEDDVPDALAQRAGPGLQKLANELRESLRNSGRGERVRHGVDIAIIGAPNSGKSSIINRLANRDAAIVSPIAGTTRDIVEVHLQFAGFAVRISDTAGLRETKDEVETEGVRRALVRSEQSDLRLGVIDVNDPDTSVLNSLKQGDLILLNKIDLVDKPFDLETPHQMFSLCAKTGAGISKLETTLAEIVKVRFSTLEHAGLTRSRHISCVKQALESIENAIENLNDSPELTGADLRSALHAIKELAGETDIEAVLDRVFTSFCIGK